MLVGTSRKSFIGRILSDPDGTPASADQRLYGTLASTIAAVLHGAHMVRVHDVKATVEALKTIHAISSANQTTSTDYTDSTDKNQTV
jgi:dihydropteroate synthase